MSATFPKPASRRHAGFTLVSAVFLLVVLAALGAFMVTISGLQHTSSTLDVLGSKAYQASRAGIEWGIFQVMNPGSPPSCFSSTPLTFSGALSGFSATVTCTQTTHTELTATINIYHIISTASSGTPGTTTYVERQLQATVGR